MTSISLGTLTSALIHTFMALPSAQNTEPDLDLMPVSAVALGDQGSADDKMGSARAALHRAEREH